MRRFTLFLITLAAPLAGCAHQGSSTRPTTRVAAPGEHDRLWLSKAYQDNIYQIQASHLAADRATLDRVRNLARLMFHEYSDLASQLETHAQQHHLALPTDMDDAHTADLEKLAAVPNGDDFDRSYLNLELKTHIQLIDLYEDEANKGEYPGARAIAQSNLPDLYSHERRILQLRPGTWSSPAKPTGDQPAPKPQPTTKK
jgi:putative membrane protein